MLLWPEADGGRLRSSDGDQYESIAFNMLRYGVYHASPTAGEGRDLKPYFKREPGYPLFLAAVFALSPEFQSLTRSCIRDTTCQAAAALRQRAQRLTSVIQAVTVASAFLAAYAWTGSWLVSIAAALFYLVILPPSDIASVIAAFLLLVHAVFAAETWRSPRLSTGVISGVALGLLILTKAVFQYWLVGMTLLCAAGLWWERSSRRPVLLRACVALLVGAGAVTLPWMVRNATQVGHFGISGRTGELLAIRAEYGRMTWSEVRGAFAFYLPTRNETLRQEVQRWLEPEVFGYARFDRDNLAGFYRRAKNGTGEVGARANRLVPGWHQRFTDHGVGREEVLTRASTELFWEDWLKHTVLTLVFLERGTFFDTRRYDRLHGVADRTHGRVFEFPVTLIQSLAGKLTYLLLPSLGLMLVVAWRRRSVELGFLVLPILYVMGIHAMATHYLPRYSYPVVPLLVLVFSITAHEAWLSHANRRDLSRTWRTT